MSAILPFSLVVIRGHRCFKPKANEPTIYYCLFSLLFVLSGSVGKTDRKSRLNLKIVKLWRKSCSIVQNQQLTCLRHGVFWQGQTAGPIRFLQCVPNYDACSAFRSFSAFALSTCANCVAAVLSSRTSRVAGVFSNPSNCARSTSCDGRS